MEAMKNQLEDRVMKGREDGRDEDRKRVGVLSILS
jgi:hypothetical protein